MLTYKGYVDGIHGAPYITAPWIRHGDLWDPMGYVAWINIRHPTQITQSYDLGTTSPQSRSTQSRGERKRITPGSKG